jgi:murein DD-endopeptidase MepM/ murein hydrolase activator NlpD
VRSFPRAARRRLCAVLLTGLTVGALSVPAGFTPAPSSAASSVAPDSDRLKAKQKTLKQQIAAADTELDHSSSQVRRTSARAEAAWARLRQARAHVAQVNAQLTAAQARDQRLQAELAAAEARLAQARSGRQAARDQKAVVATTVSEVYRQGDPRLLALASMLKSSSPEEMLRARELDRTVFNRQAGDYDRLRAAEVLLEVRRTDVQAATDLVAANRAAAAEALAEVQSLASQAVAARQSYLVSVAGARAARNQAKAARRADRAELARLKREESRIKQQILAALARERRSYTGAVGGLLLSPVNSPVTSPFGMRRHPIHGYWGMHDGVDFGEACGTPMRAAGTGRVIAQYFSSVYGHRLYLSLGSVNGKNVTVVYNHATGYGRHGVGDVIQRGQTVGWVGSTGWSTGCHLHFTVLENGDPVDPMKYL